MGAPSEVNKIVQVYILVAYAVDIRIYYDAPAGRTAVPAPIHLTQLHANWPGQVVYKRQMEIYQWLFSQNGFSVSNTGYFVYCNGKRNSEKFDAKLEFDIEVIPYSGNTDWIETTLSNIKKCLMSDKIPSPGVDCDFCTYRQAISSLKQPAK